MIYTRQKLFIEKLLCALKLNGCKTLDISFENVSIFLPILEKELENRNMKYEEDELNLLFSKDIDENYFDFYRLIENMDSLICERYEDDLELIINSDSAILLLSDNVEFKKDEIMEVAEFMKPMMVKREKVKVMSNAYN